MGKYTNRKLSKFSPVGFVLLFLIGAGMILFSRLAMLPRLKEADHQVYEREITPNANPSKLVVSEKGIAVFYEDAGYAAFYSQDGSFLYGIKVDTSDKGTGNIAFLDDLWVIYSKNNTVYFFSGSTLVEKFHVSINENSERGKEIKERMGENSSLRCQYNGDEYWISFSEHPQVKKRLPSGKETTLILLPVNKVTTFFFGLCLCLCLGSMLFFITKEGFRKKKAKPDERNTIHKTKDFS